MKINVRIKGCFNVKTGTALFINGSNEVIKNGVKHCSTSSVFKQRLVLTGFRKLIHGKNAANRSGYSLNSVQTFFPCHRQ